MKSIIHVVVGALGCTASVSQACADAQPTWSLEVLIGDAINLTSRTRIDTAQSPSSAFGGNYETRGLEAPLHYTVRLARWDADRGWELALLHHKLYLQNRPPGVEALSVSHGFNILSLSRAYAFGPWRLRLGLGPVIAHPEARIGGVAYDGPYELAGAAALGGVGATFMLTPRLSILGELAATLGYVEVHPRGQPDLTFSIRNPALHAQLGLGYRF